MKCQEGWTPSFLTPPSIYSKIGEELATQLAQASSTCWGEPGCFLQKQPPSGGRIWKAQVGLVAICTLFFTKYTPLCFFWWFFFRNVTKLCEFRNDTCFLSVRLRNLTDHVITPIFSLQKITETHGLRINISFWFPARYGISQIAQQCFLLISGTSRNFT